MNLEKVKVGSVEYTVPTPITDRRSVIILPQTLNLNIKSHFIYRSTFMAISWIMTTARERDRSKQRMFEKLAELVIETAHDTGPIIHIKNEHHKQCELNRAYAHYRRSG